MAEIQLCWLDFDQTSFDALALGEDFDENQAIDTAVQWLDGIENERSSSPSSFQSEISMRDDGLANEVLITQPISSIPMTEPDGQINQTRTPYQLVRLFQFNKYHKSLFTIFDRPSNMLK